MVSSCGGSNKELSARKAIEDSTPTVLSMPLMPDSIEGAEARAAFVAEHFWDELDFGQDSRSLDTAFMEQNFVNYLAVLSVTPKSVAQSAIERLRVKAKVSPEAPICWMMPPTVISTTRTARCAMRNCLYFLHANGLPIIRYRKRSVHEPTTG